MSKTKEVESVPNPFSKGGKWRITSVPDTWSPIMKPLKGTILTVTGFGMYVGDPPIQTIIFKTETGVEDIRLGVSQKDGKINLLEHMERVV